LYFSKITERNLLINYPIRVWEEFENFVEYSLDYLRVMNKDRAGDLGFLP
jgi:hypothetical protein